MHGLTGEFPRTPLSPPPTRQQVKVSEVNYNNEYEVAVAALTRLAESHDISNGPKIRVGPKITFGPKISVKSLGTTLDFSRKNTWHIFDQVLSNPSRVSDVSTYRWNKVTGTKTTQIPTLGTVECTKFYSRAKLNKDKATNPRIKLWHFTVHPSSHDPAYTIFWSEAPRRGLVPTELIITSVEARQPDAPSEKIQPLPAHFPPFDELVRPPSESISVPISSGNERHPDAADSVCGSTTSGAASPYALIRTQRCPSTAPLVGHKRTYQALWF